MSLKNTAALRTTILDRLKKDAHRYEVTLQFTEDLLGTAPENPDLYASYIASKVSEDANVKVLQPPAIAEKVEETAAEEVAMLRRRLDEAERDRAALRAEIASLKPASPRRSRKAVRA